MKFTAVSVFLIGCAFSFVLSHGAIGKEKDEDADDSDSDVTIEKTVLAREHDDKFEPVKSFKPDDTFAVLVFLSEAKVGTKVKAVWTLVDAGGMEDKQLTVKKIELTPETVEGTKEANRINFSLSHDDPYPAGDYKVDIYLNGELAKTVEFTIK
jgi:hypothetical protein